MNPYETPQSKSTSPLITSRLRDWSNRDLKLLSYKSHSLRVIACAFFYIAIPELLRLRVMLDDPYRMWGSFAYLVPVIYIPAGFLVALRTKSSRIFTLFVSVISLTTFPVGTITGVAGIFATLSCNQLFGPGRFKHAEIQEERLRRKFKAQLKTKTPT